MQAIEAVNSYRVKIWFQTFQSLLDLRASRIEFQKKCVIAHKRRILKGFKTVTNKSRALGIFEFIFW